MLHFVRRKLSNCIEKYYGHVACLLGQTRTEYHGLFNFRKGFLTDTRSQLIKASAREEFESSKQEKDPEVLARALVNARMAIDELHEKYKSQQMKLESDLIAHVNDTRTDRTQTRTVLGQNLRSSHVPFHSSVRIDPSSFPTFPGFKKP